MWNRIIYNTTANTKITVNIQAKTLHLKARPYSVIKIVQEDNEETEIILDCFGEIWLSDITVKSLKTEQDEMLEVSYYNID